MESKIYLAYHKDVQKPYSDCLIPYDVKQSELPHEMFSELSMVHDILCNTSLHSEYMGVAHYRRMFQTQAFEKCDIIPFLFGKEYGKESRPTLENTSEHFKSITSDFKLSLDGFDMIVLDTFKKSSKMALYSLVDIGWLTKVAVDEFYKFIKHKLPKEQYDIVYNLTMDNTEHYCNNIMYASNDVFLDYWYWVMDIICGYWIHMDGFKEHQTPRMFGYFAEYLMKPCIEIHGWKVKEQKSICLE